MRKTAIILVGIAVIALVLAGCGAKIAGVPDTVATVNGKAIDSGAYLSRLSRQAGQEMLRAMIEQQILLQWAEEEKASPTDDQVKAQIEILKRDGTYDDQVKVMGEDGLKTELTVAQARINLAKKFVKVTDKDVSGLYDAMKPQRYVHGERKQVELIINPDSSKIEEAQKKLKEGKDFTEVAGEYNDSRIAMRGPIKLWIDESQTNLPPAVSKAAKGLKVGDVSEQFSISPPAKSAQPSQYIVMKVLALQSKLNLSLKDVKSEVEDAAALQKSQMEPDFSKKLNEKMKEAKIEVKIEQFKDIVNGFKNPPEASPMMMPQGAPGP